ncbi:MAG TPA: DNA-3-methyladenine glycosylase 2 family protein [Acidimicrobiales bacterium]|nr:DNA-3-methyladenine glycosylase 2 family protein [Acidimicrobiales bacterium]
MAATRTAMADAARALSRKDPVLKALVKEYGYPPGRPHVPASMRFAVLARSILYQQLAGKAAASIEGRFVGALGGVVTPERVLAVSTDVLRACGLSGAKARSIQDLAEKVVSGQISLERIGRLSNEDVVEHLVQVRGIGQWTAEMFLLGTLGRLDIWPVGDYGVRAGFAVCWHLAETPTPKELMVLGEPYRPYRSVVAWYCWRAMDTRLPG